ncbi:hypothetical protein [Gordoniibacillus kamchatkensis]|uniref:hypothetical protein n=1 Tax=Gordoniibacillus kamchatkensis TaxID=1590651 RepID=UPI000A51A5DF|nr:hypothetical protein [Paenibacillus sp. VKM B-2647]
MQDRKRKGLVGFRQPAAKLVAEAPSDEEMRGKLEEWRMNDGYPGSCGIAGSDKPE